MGRRRKKRKFFDLLSPSRKGFNFNIGNYFDVSEETKKGIFVIILFTLSLLSILALFDLAGDVGKVVVNILRVLFGDLAWVFPLLTLAFCYFLIREDRYNVKWINYLGAGLLVLGFTSVWHMWYLRTGMYSALEIAAQFTGGGYLGVVLSWPLIKLMSFWGSLVFSLAIFFIGMLLTFETSIHGLMWPAKLLGFLFVRLKDFYLMIREKFSRDETEEEDLDEEDDEEEKDAYEEDDESVQYIQEDDDEKDIQFAKKEVSLGDNGDEEMASDIAKPKKFGRKIELPLSLLSSNAGKPTSGDVKTNQEIIRKTLANFRIDVEMGTVNIGPTVTQYTFRPADGVKLSKITNLNSDLALALASHPVRIEAPIPGKSLVGIEIPNKMASKVVMNELLTSKNFKDRESNLSVSLGKDVSGIPYFGRLDKMPHLLIAGSTGSGKSVCINSVIVSLLFQNSPDDLKFILVDPKRVELPIYNGIPYLLTPVITDVKKTINALKWTIVEMERRFDLLSRVHKRNIEAYNKATKDRLPYIVFIIDELADLMSVASNDIENGIVRLAQMARAVGIHLILATQRPSVEVITGLIKANIPARIAFSVSSSIDSRTILDESGAEKLVGRGDMLYVGPEFSKPKRLQGVFLSDREIKDVVNFIKEQGDAEYIDEIVEKQGSMVMSGGGFSDNDGDSLLGEAKEVIRQSSKASASLLQRKLKIGYARAARILDLLEEQEIIGPADGAKAREVFLDRLDGVSAVEFAAREHDLEGELMGQDISESNEDYDFDNSEINEDENEELKFIVNSLEEKEEESITKELKEDENNSKKKSLFDEDEWT